MDPIRLCNILSALVRSAYTSLREILSTQACWRKREPLWYHARRQTIALLVLEGERYRSLGSFSGDDQLPSQVLPGLVEPARRFFPS